MKGGADQRPGVGEGEPCHLTVAKCEGWSVSPAYKPRPTPRLEALHPRPAATQQLPLEGADWSREPPAPLGSPQPRGSLGPFWDKQRLHPDAGTALTPCLEAGPGHPNPREQPLAPQDLWPRPCEPSGPGLGSGQANPVLHQNLRNGIRARPRSSQAGVWRDGPIFYFCTMGQVGRQLAIIGDDINQRYDSEFQTMLQHLQPTAENAYEYFTKIASSLFESGINWGRVVALLGFGYRLALHVYQRGLTGFLGQVTRFVADFMLHHCIARWIAQRGGWVAALNLGNGPILNVLIVLSLVLLGQFVVRRFFKS
uniref:Bcl-2 homologous antagonist/killer n=1 Tax=Ailuropoda melanoleuca TaxID=9646 RepID=A0A7N5JYN4_AILME